MGTVSVDVRAVDTGERRTMLGGSSAAAGSSNEDSEPNEPSAVGKLEGRLRGAMRQTPSKGHPANGERFSEEDYESDLQRLKFAYPNSKRNAKKSAGRKRRVTFAKSSNLFVFLIENNKKKFIVEKDVESEAAVLTSIGELEFLIRLLPANFFIYLVASFFE
ncbi:uncharacterized protein LOC143179582 [Calliopsis andreniformis]|uniref:uncharacterized protein LOC143179582 n=1 Tax=Calliopsis andreniformis TaxID=337506 RepID=UPI003FCE9D7B